MFFDEKKKKLDKFMNYLRIAKYQKILSVKANLHQCQK